MKIGYEPAPLENAGHSQIAGKQNEQEKQSVEVQTSEGGAHPRKRQTDGSTYL